MGVRARRRAENRGKTLIRPFEFPFPARAGEGSFGPALGSGSDAPPPLARAVAPVLTNGSSHKVTSAAASSRVSSSTPPGSFARAARFGGRQVIQPIQRLVSPLARGPGRIGGLRQIKLQPHHKRSPVGSDRKRPAYCPCQDCLRSWSEPETPFDVCLRQRTRFPRRARRLLALSSEVRGLFPGISTTATYHCHRTGSRCPRWLEACFPSSDRSRRTGDLENTHGEIAHNRNITARIFRCAFVYRPEPA